MQAQHLTSETNMAPKQQPPTPVRLPQELKDWVKARAEVNLRSMNAEITALLIWAREMEEKRPAWKGPPTRKGKSWTELQPK
jgi:hypothetical protein